MADRTVFLNILFFAIPESEYEYIHYRNKMENTAFSVLSNEGMDVKFLKLKEPGYKPLTKNADEYFFRGKNKFFFLPWKLYFFIRQQKPRVVFVHSFIFPFQLLILKLFISRNTKIVIQHHAEKPFAHPFKRWLQKLAYSRADAYLFASRDLANSYLEAKIIREKGRVQEVMEGSCIFEPQDKVASRQKLNLEAETIFLWVGRLNQNKDPLTVLKAINSFKTQNQNFKLVMIYGSTEMENEVKGFIQENELASLVTLVGTVSHVELEDWFGAADYFLSASHYEGSGIALCEAMACGCVPIATRIDSFKSMTNNGQFGYLFEAGNDKQLSEILFKLRPADLDLIKEQVLRKFKEDLSFEAIGARISSIVSELLK